jgi:hypothetical protein
MLRLGSTKLSYLASGLRLHGTLQVLSCQALVQGLALRRNAIKQERHQALQQALQQALRHQALQLRLAGTLTDGIWKRGMLGCVRVSSRMMRALAATEPSPRLPPCSPSRPSGKPRAAGAKQISQPDTNPLLAALGTKECASIAANPLLRPH